MLRTSHKVVLKPLSCVLLEAGHTPLRISLASSFPLTSPSLCLSPVALTVPCHDVHLAPLQACQYSSVTSYPIVSSRLPSIHPVLSARLSTSPLVQKIRSKVEGGDLQKSKKKQYAAPYITLIDTEEKVSKMGLDQAERLAKRRDLKLVKVEDQTLTKGSKDVYRLLTGKQYFEEEIRSKKSEKKSQSGTKDEKSLAIGGNITEHDLAFKMHNVTKWLSKGYQVKVTIASKKSLKEDMEKVFCMIEDEVKKHNSRIVQRHQKGEDIRFYISPPKVKEEDVASKETAQEGDRA